jgi:hypothetical protein
MHLKPVTNAPSPGNKTSTWNMDSNNEISTILTYLIFDILMKRLLPRLNQEVEWKASVVAFVLYYPDCMTKSMKNVKHIMIVVSCHMLWSLIQYLSEVVHIHVRIIFTNFSDSCIMVEKQKISKTDELYNSNTLNNFHTNIMSVIYNFPGLCFAHIWRHAIPQVCRSHTNKTCFFN